MKVQSVLTKGKIATAIGLLACAPAFADLIFTQGDIVVSVEGAANTGGTYADNQASPLSLYEFTTGGTLAGTMQLSQTANGANAPVSGEYGSSSEGTLQLSGNGQYLTIMGYGINAAQFNANPGSYSPVNTNTALAQSGSLTGLSYTPVSRVVALIDANGNVDSSTQLYGVFSGNNPRSAYTLDGTSIYVSGQGTDPDHTSGIFHTTVGTNNFNGLNNPTPITGDDTTTNTFSQDTREVQIYNGQLYTSVDTKGGTGAARSFVGTLGTGTPTTTVGAPTGLTGFGNVPGGGTGKYTMSNGIGNSLNAGQQINLSPQNYFFANATTLYVADDGAPKNDSTIPKNGSGSSVGDGGLQKWSLISGTWTLDYTLTTGLNLVENAGVTGSPDQAGSTGLYGLTGEVVGGQVELFATNYTQNDLDQTYLYGITDTLADTTPGQVSAETFTQLAAAPADSNFKGVSFAPTSSSQGAATPEPGSIALIGLGLGALGLIRRRRRSN